MTYIGRGGCRVTGSVPDGGFTALTASGRRNYNGHK